MIKKDNIFKKKIGKFKGTKKVFSTFKEAMAYIDEIEWKMKMESDLRTINIEDRISGEIYYIGFNAVKDAWSGYKFVIDKRDETDFTRKKLGTEFR